MSAECQNCLGLGYIDTLINNSDRDERIGCSECRGVGIIFGGDPECRTCDDNGIVGNGPDNYFDCPDCMPGPETKP